MVALELVLEWALEWVQGCQQWGEEGQVQVEKVGVLGGEQDRHEEVTIHGQGEALVALVAGERPGAGDQALVEAVVGIRAV